MERKPVEVTCVVIKCPTGGVEAEIPLKSIAFRGWNTQCNDCDFHGGVDMDIGICPVCNETHPVTTLMEY